VSAVAVIGLGQIGGGALQSLVRGGHEVVAHDVRPEAVEAVADQAIGAATPREASRGRDVVLVAVYDDAQVRDVLAGDDGILAADPPPKVVLILSTVTAETIGWAGEQARSAGVGLLDCGVTGGGQAIAAGTIVALVGGEDASVEIARPAIESFAATVLRMGPLGSGMKAKLARNMIVYGCWFVVSEAARLAAASGVDLGKLVQGSMEADRLTGGSHVLLARHGIAPTPAADESDATYALRRGLAGYAHKDLDAALALASELRIDLPVTDIVARRFEDAVGLAPSAAAS
jgi:3-hydroxyisobutyrate dehydrogenase-like beta-hydroxyacid dehydrogenase